MLKELDEKEKVLRKEAQESINKLKKVWCPYNTNGNIFTSKLMKICSMKYEYDLLKRIII
jgi:hypothetical protein